MTIALREISTDARTVRNLFAAYPSGVTAICAVVDGKPVGMAASSFTSVSIEPPLVSICIQTNSTTWPSLRQCRKLGVSVLAANQDNECRQLSAKGVDRFDQVEWKTTEDDAVLIANAASMLECSIETEIEAGDHLIVLLRIHRYGTSNDIEPLVFHGGRFRELLLETSAVG